MMEKIKQEILLYNYWEHFKAEKDLSMILTPEDIRRKKINKSMRELLSKINIDISSND